MTVYRNRQRQSEWRYDFKMDGKRFSGPCLNENGSPASTKTAARQVEERERVAARQRKGLAKNGLRQGNYSLAQAAAFHLSRKEDKTQEHFDNQKLYVREICAFFGTATAIAAITGEDVEAYRKYCSVQTLKKWIGGPRRRPTGDPEQDARYWKDTGRRRGRRQVNNYLKCLRALFAIVERVRDPVTRLPILDQGPEVRLYKMSKRLPRPISDEELHARLENAPPWTREAAELARLFGLRLGEALKLQRRHVDHEIKGLRFPAGDTKSGNDERAHGGAAGWQLLEILCRQAIQRGQMHLVTWPGPKHFRHFLTGQEVPHDAWVPLKGITRSWRTTIRKAGIEDAHRFHDVRARYVTEVAKVQPAAAQQAARHQDPATTALYVRLASDEIADAVSQAVAKRPLPKLKVVK